MNPVHLTLLLFALLSSALADICALAPPGTMGCGGTGIPPGGTSSGSGSGSNPLDMCTNNPTFPGCPGAGSGSGSGSGSGLDSETETPPPSAPSITPAVGVWVLSNIGQTCNQACSFVEGQCHEESTLSVDVTDIEAILEVVFEVSNPCQSESELDFYSQSAITADAYYTESSSACNVFSVVGKQICCCSSTGCAAPQISTNTNASP